LCDGFVGNDTGVTHLAAAVGLPTVGILGSTSPARFGAVGPKTRLIYHQVDCSPCLARTCPFEHYNCMLWVTPHEIADTLANLGAFKLYDESSTQPGWLDWQREWHEPKQVAIRPR
jgi:ADP-heptose:LPS heptosyltransferase